MMEPWATGGRYLNFSERPTDTRTAYDVDTYRRLQDVRRRVDPQGIFQANHPIDMTP